MSPTCSSTPEDGSMNVGPSQFGAPSATFTEEPGSGNENSSPPTKRKRGGQPKDGSGTRRKLAHVSYEQRRRRMINQGFERLKALLPDDGQDAAGDSRARLLERAADRIQELEARLAAQDQKQSMPLVRTPTMTGARRHSTDTLPSLSAMTPLTTVAIHNAPSAQPPGPLGGSLAEAVALLTQDNGLARPPESSTTTGPRSTTRQAQLKRSVASLLN